jgi:hypothetical protein
MEIPKATKMMNVASTTKTKYSFGLIKSSNCQTLESFEVAEITN